MKKRRGPGSIIRDTLAAWWISEHAGCGCNEIATKMDQEGADIVEQKIDQYVSEMSESIKNWRKNHSIPIPQPPIFIIRGLIEYGISKSRQEHT